MLLHHPWDWLWFYLLDGRTQLNQRTLSVRSYVQRQSTDNLKSKILHVFRWIASRYFLYCTGGTVYWISSSKIKMLTCSVHLRFMFCLQPALEIRNTIMLKTCYVRSSFFGYVPYWVHILDSDSCLKHESGTRFFKKTLKIIIIILKRQKSLLDDWIIYLPVISFWRQSVVLLLIQATVFFKPIQPL